jgi:putative spermidine/putrescine transport system permease protein
MAAGTWPSRDDEDVSGSGRGYLRDALLRLRADPVRLWILPAAIVFLVFYIFPIVQLLLRSVYDKGFTAEHYVHLINEPIYRLAFVTTFRVAFVVTIACILIGYPIAYLLRRLQPPALHVVLAIVLIPFWTSVLVRSYAFIALLARTGAVNKALISLGLIDRPLPLLYNETGVVIGMTYVLLPMMVLTIYSAMHGIEDRLLAASDSLGARPIVSFFRVFLPLSLPGVWTGSLLVFLTGIGFFITPALLGGGRVPTLATMIESQMHGVLNWGLGSALSVTLLATTVVIFVLFDRLIGMESLLRKH